MKKIKSSPFFLRIATMVGIVTMGGFAHGADFSKNSEKKQVAKDAKRWSLAEWLEQKKNSQLMDTWLMFNSPSPYEFFFGLDTATLKKAEGLPGALSESTFRNYRASFAAYASIIGLYGEYELAPDESEQWKGFLLLRLLGSSDQSTNLTLHYGLMGRQLKAASTEENWSHQVAGAKFNLYILKAFALTGRYEHVIRATSRESQISAQGNRFEAGAHIEYSLLRFYGFWFQERTELDNQAQRNTEGLQFGGRIYF